ncbi:unnamed protein product [Orchesella dallaii]|uniref:Ferric-chelate reductase 1 n=1 Tax=Orchesella dallaii TaxID=48710 RepID=A0ABP1RPI2_9HEXA
MLLKLLVAINLWYFVPLPSRINVEGHPTIQCAQTGAGKLSTGHTTYETWDWSHGSFTIGAKRYDSYFGGAMNSAYGFYEADLNITQVFRANASAPEAQHCNYTLNPKAAWKLLFCDENDQKMKLRINAVQQTDPSTGKILTLEGWLHIEVELVDKEDSIRMMYLQMYDEYFNAIGEFIRDPTEQCTSSDPEIFVSPTEFQYLPCSAIGAREAQPSQAVYMVDRKDLNDKSLNISLYLPSKEMSRAVHLTWRMNEYWCSRHYRIIPMVFVLTTKNIEDWSKTTHSGAVGDSYFGFYEQLGTWRLYRKIPNYWLLPDWIGAADIKHPDRGALLCNNPIWNASWIRGKFKHSVNQEYMHHSNVYTVYRGPEKVDRGALTCQQNPYFIKNYAKFVGRCQGHRSKNTSSSYFHNCNTNTSSPEFQGLKYTFVKLTPNPGRYKPCRSPQTLEDAINISREDATFTKPVIEIGYGLSHKSRAKTSIGRFWRGRKFHGIVCLIVTLFLMPISHFMARHYKETFMDFQFKGIHIWYWVHVCGSFAALGVLLTGQIAMGHTLESWGRSKSLYAIWHHALGWISIFLHILMVLYGGFRSAIQKRNKIVMILHSTVGFLIHGLNIFVLIPISTFIPASPSLRQCDRFGYPTGLSVTFWITLAWAGLDALFHGFLTVLQITADKRLEIKRPLLWCPILPILDPNSHVDMRSSGLRKLLFYLYLFLSIVFTLGATIHLAVKYQPDFCVIGEMSCKAALGCTKIGLAMCKKLSIKNAQDKRGSRQSTYLWN